MEQTITTTWRGTAKQAALLAALMLATLLAAAATAIAQERTPENPSPEPPGPPPSVEQTNLVAELTVKCPENIEAFYRLVTTGVESRTDVVLTDEDHDGVYTGTQTFPKFPPGPRPVPPNVEPITVDDVRIVAPDGSTVKQFGPVKLDQDEIILPATISLCDGGGSDGNSNNKGGSDNSSGSSNVGDGGSGSATSGSGSGNGSGEAKASGVKAKELPKTGGFDNSALLALGAGTLLVGAGLLVRRIVVR